MTREMTMKRKMLLIPWALCLLTLRALGAPSPDPVFDVPSMHNIIVDGDLSDWGDAGLLVQTLTSIKGAAWPKATPPASLRLGWNAQGLLAAITVHHKDPHEYDYIRHLFKGDSVEFFVSLHKGSRDRYMVVISPGIDPKYPEPRHCFFPDPSEQEERDVDNLLLEVGRVRTEDGYTLEVLLPWSNLGVEPRVGAELGLQVYVAEADKNEQALTAMWYPAGESHLDPGSVHRVRLAASASHDVHLAAAAQDDVRRNSRQVRIVGTTGLSGKSFDVRTEKGIIFGALAPHGSQSYGTFDLPREQSFELVVNREQVPAIQLPPEDNPQTVLSQKLKCGCKPVIFQGSRFPSPYLEGGWGYNITKVVYYNARYELVSTANEPGRYGAVVEITGQKGKLVTQRFRTLFKVPEKVGSWEARSNGLAELPRHVMEDWASAAAPPDDGRGPAKLNWLADPAALEQPDAAALLAWMVERDNQTRPAEVLHDFRLADRQWWVGLKRRLYGWEKQFPDPIICPRPLDGPPAVTLREGTCAEAGVSQEAINRLDTFCRSAVHDEPVSICIARHGVIFFQHAYGNSGEQPMTVDTLGDMQSATKPLSGCLMMMMVDQGLIKLEDPVDRFLPPFRNVKVKAPLTIRHLYTHMSGLSGTWGDEMHDTEQVVGGYYGSLDVGTYSYNSVGFALGAKIIEAFSGEAFPLFARRHLLDPLGMTHTRVTLSADAALTTSSEYARLGQMLLNRGAYGNQRFLSVESCAKMLPIDGWGARGGIGLTWLQQSGLPRKTAFGHNAGNSSFFCVEPALDLVVVISSAGSRKDFAPHFNEFFELLTGALEPAPTTPKLPAK